MRHFYAFDWSHGFGSFWNGEKPAGSVVVFTSKATRDAWVEDGPDYKTQCGYRSSVDSAWVRRHCDPEMVAYIKMGLDK